MDLASIQNTYLGSLLETCYGYELSESEFMAKAGKEHYKLLGYLSKQQTAGSEIFDIGTHCGASALALSLNPEITVHSFDIQHKHRLPCRKNIHFHLEDLLTDPAIREKWSARILASPLIFMDIDPHEGTREYEFYQWLKANRYQGAMVCDDIWYFKEMRDNFWYKIPSEEKCDLTSMGHWSGTGVVRFVPSSLFPTQPSVNNWTVVTAYFDLTKMSDASASIRARPGAHYLSNANATMTLDQNLIVFCEAENLEKLRALRPAHLADKTKYIVQSFEDFPLTQYREKIIENRRKNPYRFDDRNTASYYLFCMSRYAMLEKAIAENPFNSTHFCWLNICIERMGYKNLAELDSVFLAQRDKFSTCYIDYRPESLVFNLPEYFRYGGLCSMCSGFFTGRWDYMSAFCAAIQSVFLEFLTAGYGHADEQLFSAVYFKNPSLFEFYYGDYSEMVTNYCYVKDRWSEPLRLLTAHSFEHGDFQVCRNACMKLIESYKKGYAFFNKEELDRLLAYAKVSSERLGLPEIDLF